MLADVAGLDLPVYRVIRRIGQAAALEALQEDPLVGSRDFDVGPVGLGDRVAGGVEGVQEEPVFDEPPSCQTSPLEFMKSQKGEATRWVVSGT